MIKEFAIMLPIFVTLFWSLVFLFQSGKRDKPKFNLGLLMLFAFMLYCSHAVFFLHLYHLYSYFEAIYVFTMLSMYPLYYKYTLSLTSVSLNFKQQLDYFLPAILFCFFALVMTILLSPEERVLYVKETLIDKNLKDLDLNSWIGVKGMVFFVSRVFFLIQIFYFGILVYRLMHNHNQQLEEYYSNTEGKTLDWLKIVNVIILFAAISSITFTLIGRSYFSQNEVSLLIPSILFSSFFFFIGFKGNHQLQINTGFSKENFDFNFSEIKNDQLKQQLIDLFENEKFYKNSELRITTVSERLETNRTYISKMFNEEFNMNFSDFVNKYRVEEAKQLLMNADNKMYTMEYIAEKSGFGSVNSFSRVFKKATGVTPGRFRMQSALLN